ncbi:FAD-dependent oxidoreductase [Actinocrispum wychmicini]|uniref:2-polyprenyl-6-methoxyphenol hydroxylase-like FAD-dependent oxidoreductase n=1 Tax=Actinocrispum wychmicini TaxID=1213861 RepID=A0A4R2JG07_9PSEU|nr:FAD-dependent oxidoreductase [Actinocrispum wychmicini]TCO58703.1 2-polyprenyl-6-methoxyphenol hydroxylase-like FAD-dependent oxidoreductase [Actinocrispum wychmicini]
MTDVLVVGAGPTGLLLAGDLAEAGLSVTVLERRPHAEANTTRAFAVHARTLEELDIRGVADQVIATGEPLRALRLFGKVAVDLSSLATRFNYVLITPQYNVESVLLERAERLGARIERDAEVVGLSQDAETVTARLADGTTHEAKYLVGADGVGSRVRQLLGVPFPGKSVLKSIMLADVRVTEEPDSAVTVNATGPGFAFVSPFGDGWYRVFAWNRNSEVSDSAPVDLDEIRAVTRSVLGTDFGMHDPRWVSRFHSDERQVPSYRFGRVFLAGDAAHCHSPAGGMGMNTGMQDAANLGWKLAAVLRGQATDRLLDTYQTERHPVGKMVLNVSGRIIRAAMLRSPATRLVRNTLVGFALRRTRIATRAAGMISGVAIDYGTATRVPDMPVAAGRLYETLRGGHFVLVANDPPANVPDHVRVVRPVTPVAEPILVRPDGYRAPLTWL